MSEQQLRAPSVWRSAHSFRVTATTSAPRRRSSTAATAESTPPLVATSTRSAPDGGSDSTSPDEAASIYRRDIARMKDVVMRAGIPQMD